MSQGKIFILVVILCAIALAVSGRAFARAPETHPTVHADTAADNRTAQLAISMYDQLAGKPEIDSLVACHSKAKSGNNGRLFRLLSQMFFVDIRESSKENKQIVDEAEQLARYKGKIINSVSFERHDIFEDKSTWLRSLANGMHMRTVEGAIARDLLFGTGDAFDPEVAVASNRLLQSRPYISNSWLRVDINPADTAHVDITVVTLDSWTIGVDGEHLRSNRGMFYLYDYNFLGMGNNVGVKTYMTYKNFRHRGSIALYNNPNFLGTFYTANLRFGHNFDNTYNEASVSKDFILPDDYEAGAAFAKNKVLNFKILTPDEIELHSVRYRTLDIWGGRSRFIPSLKSSLFLTGHFSSSRFTARPAETSASVNPEFHSRDELLFGTGFYWERFYSSSMIYGYGFQEYIASGQKIQLTGGYSWQEFGNYWYGGVTMEKGGFTALGYMLCSATAGSYVDVHNGAWWQSAVNVRSMWFSNLWGRGRSKVRQFVTVSYTRGWNRGEGAGALIRFTQDARPTSFDAYAAGSNRLLVNTETVFFTPLSPLGFRIVLFGFADAGWIGNRDNSFANDFYSTFGIGVRVKNERLVFSALQFRLGFAVGRHGLIHNNMFSGSVEQRIGRMRFIPTRPVNVQYE